MLQLDSKTFKNQCALIIFVGILWQEHWNHTTSQFKMTVTAFFGCAFTAYGPALAMFILTIAHDPVRVIILILSAFFWLLSLLLSSLLWFAVVPLKDTLAFGLVFSVLFQEAFRVLIYVLLTKADTFMKKLTENEETQIFANRHILSYVVGLGFGMMSGIFSMINVLADSVGPGTVGLMDNTPKDFFMISAALCLCMIFLNTFWGVIAFDAMDKKKWTNLAFVWVSHLTVSCLTLLNQNASVTTYAGTVVPIILITIGTTVFSFFVAGGKKSAMIECLTSPLSFRRTNVADVVIE